MKSGAVVVGVFMLVGLIAGAFVIAHHGRDQTGEQDLKLVHYRINELAGSIDLLVRDVRDLDGKLENSLASIRENARGLREVREQLAKAESKPADIVAKKAPVKSGDAPPVRLSEGLDAPDQAVIERLKDKIKEEIKNESIIAKKEWVVRQVKQLEKRIDEDLAGLAQKLNLDRNQQLAVKDISEEIIRQIGILWDDWQELLATATDEEWVEFKRELGSVYENAQRQLSQHVSKEQAQAIMKFIRKSK